MTRKELYAEVIKYNLQSSIKDALNKSYTNCHCGGVVVQIQHNYKGTNYVSL